MKYTISTQWKTITYTDNKNCSINIRINIISWRQFIDESINPMKKILVVQSLNEEKNEVPQKHQSRHSKESLSACERMLQLSFLASQTIQRENLLAVLVFRFYTHSSQSSTIIENKKTFNKDRETSPTI